MTHQEPGVLPRPVRLSPGDVLRLGALGVRTRRLRAALSALGIAIGIATMIAVTSIPASGQAALDARLGELGPNLLVAQAGGGDLSVVLPSDADAMVRRIGPVTAASAVGNTNRSVQRTDRSDPVHAVGIAVLAAHPDLLGTIGGALVAGRFLDPATAAFPTVVLGHQAASWLGIASLDPTRPAPQVFVDARWFTVVGILAPLPLAPDLDQAVLVGWDAARTYLAFDGHPTVVYATAREDAVEAVRDVLPATVGPELPGLVEVSRPSDALAAKRATQTTFSGLYLGLAAVALLVGGIGVANTMVVSVLERRREIGLRRALGASRAHVRGQFLTEAVVLSALGGIAGAVLGAIGTLGYALAQGWPVVVVPAAVGGALAGALLVGVVAGVYPSVRASRLAPMQALAGT